MTRDFAPMTPKVSGGPLRVLVVGRVSTIHQDIDNIEASYRYTDKFLDQRYQGPLHVKRLGEQGSGMRTDRASIIEAEEEIKTGTWDLVIAEDLSKFYRNPRHQYEFVQDAVDAGTRVICIGDNLDTADPNWEVTLSTATVRHGLHIPDTRRRVRRTAHHAFHNGGMVAKVRFGYRRLSQEDADSGLYGKKGLKIAKVPECTSILQELRRRVLDGVSYRALADWLNESRVSPGPYVTSGAWTDSLVVELLRDPILHGERTFNDVVGTPFFRTGKCRRRKNPDGPDVEHYAELAHFTIAEHEELIQSMDQRSKDRVTKAGPDHPSYNKPVSRVLWPQQHPRCSVCGERFHSYIGDQLRCAGSFPKGGPTCWNHVQVHGAVIRRTVLPLIVQHCEQTTEFRTALADAAWAELQVTRRRYHEADRAVDDEIRELEQRAKNLAQAIAIGGELSALVSELRAIDARLLATRARKLAHDPTEASGLDVRSRFEVELQLQAAVEQLSANSYEFADVMRTVLPTFAIQPVQALDTGLVRPRAKLVLRLSALLGKPGTGNPGLPQPGDVPMVVNLFDPPVHIAAVPSCVTLKRAEPKLTLDKIGNRLKLNRMTVKRALDYARRMEAEGLEDPYRELTECPAEASRWKPRTAS